MQASRPQSYILCTTPRSGSTMLCRMLAATGVAGAPDSHFHTPLVARWFEVHGIDPAGFQSAPDALRAVVAAARTRGTGCTGMFGLRMQQGSLRYFLEQLRVLSPARSTDRDRISAAFGPTAYIYLTRTDRLGQAMSRLRAEQTGLWHRAADGTELERTRPPQEPRYDRAAIAAHLTDLAAQDAAWEAWFARQRIAPIRIGYETLVQDPADSVAGLLRALSRDASRAGGLKPQTARLADRITAAWRARYLAGTDPRESGS